MIRLALLAAAVLGVAGSASAEEPTVSTPFNGKDLTGWKVKGAEAKSKWKAGKAAMDATDNKKLTVANVEGDAAGELVNAAGGGVDIYTEAKWGDCTVDLELMVPKGSNSGVYLMGMYEVQVLDSFGKEKVGAGDIGGIYGAKAPKVNASKAPGEWQRFVIEFQAPKFEGEKKVANAKFIKVTLNDQLIQEDVEMKGPTGGALSKTEAPTGPLMFQGDHGPVSYRNIKIFPK